jgi:hypothetical protein
MRQQLGKNAPDCGVFLQSWPPVKLHIPTLPHIQV